ncbi:unnamed protein product [Adineta steineri]|uniref:Uncharacterized protein n=1 Tax=Adineta steineri TaxID=433720 RepID=A0A815UNH7_9BILA|nr:unnamed protein product [Adineta steineri]CAF1650423.1 unnamed protein product [Adineta steineri]
MHLQIFIVLAICIAVSYTQAPSAVVVPAVKVVETTVTTTVDSTTTTAAAAADAHDGSKEDADNNKDFDHKHDDHHEHDATVSVDLHNILDLLKQHLHQTEERIIAEIHKDHSSTPASKESYRTADRKAKKDDKKKKDKKKSNGKHDDDDKDD